MDAVVIEALNNAMTAQIAANTTLLMSILHAYTNAAAD
jgi:hypothetical protein